jgi:hypothetical protein
MSSHDVDAIVTIVIGLVAIAVGLIPFVAFFVYVFFQTSKRKRIRERMLSTQALLVGNHQWVPVRFASEPRFKSWFKIFPWEGAGVLVMVPGSVLFLGETNSGQAMSVQFSPVNADLQWIGKTPFPNGAVSWFHFTNAAGKQYFSSETGAFVFGSHRSTKEAFDRAVESFRAAVT